MNVDRNGNGTILLLILCHTDKGEGIVPFVYEYKITKDTEIYPDYGECVIFFDKPITDINKIDQKVLKIEQWPC